MVLRPFTIHPTESDLFGGDPCKELEYEEEIDVLMGDDKSYIDMEDVEKIFLLTDCMDFTEDGNFTSNNTFLNFLSVFRKVLPPDLNLRGPEVAKLAGELWRNMQNGKKSKFRARRRRGISKKRSQRRRRRKQRSHN